MPSNSHNIAFDLGGVAFARDFPHDARRSAGPAAEALGIHTLCPHNNEDWIPALKSYLNM